MSSKNCGRQEKVRQPDGNAGAKKRELPFPSLFPAQCGLYLPAQKGMSSLHDLLIAVSTGWLTCIKPLILSIILCVHFAWKQSWTDLLLGVPGGVSGGQEHLNPRAR